MPYRRKVSSESEIRSNALRKIEKRRSKEVANFPWNVVLELLVAYLTEDNQREDSMFLQMNYVPILLRVHARKLDQAISGQMNEVADSSELLEKVVTYVNEIANAVAPIQ